MALRLILFITFLFSFSAHADQMCTPRADLFSLEGLQDFVHYDCLETKGSKECQDLYAKMKQNNENPDEKGLVCSEKNVVLKALETNFDFRAGCAMGGWNFVTHTVTSIASMVGKGTAKMVANAEKERNENALCDKDPAKKKAIFADYNNRVPKMLRVEAPAEGVVQRSDCARLKESLKTAQGRQGLIAMEQVRLRLDEEDSKYTPEEQEYVDWVKSMKGEPGGKFPNLIGAAHAKLNEMGVKLQCYNTYEAAALTCEAIAFVATVAAGPAGFALKAAHLGKIAKLAGVPANNLKNVEVAAVAGEAAQAAKTTQKVKDFVGMVKSADRRGSGGVGQQLTNASQKDEILKVAGSMTPEERVASLEALAGRKLSAAEAKQLQKMHEVGTSEGRTYQTLTKADKDKKFELSQKINPETGRPYFSINDTNIMMRNGITGIDRTEDAAELARLQQALQLKDYAKYVEAASKQDYSQWHRLHAEAAGNLGKTQESAGAYQRAYTAYVKEQKVDFANPTQLNQQLNKMTERELYMLENLAAYSGKTEKLNEVTKAKWVKIENSIKERYRNQRRSGAPEEIENTITAAFNDLKAQRNSSNPLTQKAVEEKIKALKAAYPGLH